MYNDIMKMPERIETERLYLRKPRLEMVGMVHEGLLQKYIVHPNTSNVPRDSYRYAIVKQ